MISERRPTIAGRFLIVLPVTPELIRLHRADREPDLAFLRRKLDDLHWICFTNLQIDLFLARLVPRLVELGHMNEPLDAFIELDERPEVRHANDFAFNSVAHVMAREEVVPDV